MIKLLRFSFLIPILFLGLALSGQSTFTIQGTISDAANGEGLPFATVILIGEESNGTTSDIDGNYTLQVSKNSGQLKAEYLGYKGETISVSQFAEGQVYNFSLEGADVVLENVEIVAEKVKYDKSNPAVRLIKEVVKKRNKNKPGKKSYLKFTQYSSKSLALNDVTKETLKKGMWKQMDFLEQYIDTLEEGKQVVSFFLKEQVEEYLYTNGNDAKKELINEQKSELDMRFFDDNVEQILDHLIQKVDVYDNNLYLLSTNFQNPISKGGTGFYRYYIIDTLQNDRGNVIHLWTTPSNKKDIGFTGDIYIQDVDKAIVKVEYSLDKRARLNWATDVKFKQEFAYVQDQWVDKGSTFQALFEFFNVGNGVLGKSRTVNSGYQFSKSGKVIYIDGMDQMSPSLENRDNSDPGFWIKYRGIHESDEGQVLEMIDSLNTNKKFGLIKNLSQILVTGHLNFNTIEIGPLASTYTYNPIEGSRLKFGFRTTNKLFPKVHFLAHLAYGVRDQKFKHRVVSLYSFNDDFDRNPVHYVAFVFGKDQYALGQELSSSYRSGFLTSFVRGTNRTFLQSRFNQLIYDHELKKDFRYRLYGHQYRHRGIGDLNFLYTDPDDDIVKTRDVNITALGTRLRWAPNEHYIEINNERIPIHSKNPIFELEVERAIPNLLSGDVEYTKAKAVVFKRMYLSKYGFSDFLLEGGQYWGKEIPFHLLFIPEGNQTFFYKHRLYNMMNFFEFVTDRYASINYRHYFSGYIMNRLPLINKLNLRTVVTMKALWGDLEDDNNPVLNNNLIQFPDNVDSNSFLLGKDPYLEGSVGITNIFKVLRVDLVKRFTYLDTQDVPFLFGKKGLAIRLRIEAAF